MGTVQLDSQYVMWFTYSTKYQKKKITENFPVSFNVSELQYND